MSRHRSRIVAATLGAVLSLLTFQAATEDIDLFSVDENNLASKPNVLIVLDNSSNWSRQAQKWPSSVNPIIVNGQNFLSDNSQSPTQGQSEVRAILKVLQRLNDGAVNMGLLEFSTAGNSNTNQAGYVRQHIVPMTGEIGDPNSNKGRFALKLKRIYENVNDPTEKKDQNNAFGTLLWDVYNYLGGLVGSVNGSSTPTTLADPEAYATQWSRFNSPLSAADSCRRTVVIFIGNNTSSGPTNDSDNQDPRPIQALTGLGGNAADLQFPEYRTVINRTVREDNLGLSDECYRDDSRLSACTNDVNSGQGQSQSQCTLLEATNCSCTLPSTTQGCSGNGNSIVRFRVAGDFQETLFEPTGRFVAPPANSRWTADEWARFLSTTGVPLPGTVTEDDPLGVRVPVTTYTLDVFNRQQDANFSALLRNMASVSRGKYFQARSEADIEAALLNILSEVQAVNSAFSSASLPVSATNRAQSENQVFIGLFRPDRVKNPLWFGNLKRYQIVRDDGESLQLGDSLGRPAINNNTGFLSECATSWWSVNSNPNNYWERVNTDNPDARSLCETSVNNPWSDSPDGPYVEKGAAAQVLRRGTGIADANDNFVLDRRVKTQSSSNNTLVPFARTNVPDSVSDEVLAFSLGQDRLDDDRDGNQTEPRSTIHGDVIHSRPQPVNYGGNTGVVVYYGANDGHLRAVKAEDGRELWSFIAREHFDKLARLYRNEPKIRFFGDGAVGQFEVGDEVREFQLERKDYFFDGSIGLLQNENNTRIWIYPSMRRGGRMVYAFDVTDPNNPTLKWKRGCPSAGSDTDCSANMSNIGQTWSLPSPIPVANGESGTDWVVAFGGGYDPCEDNHGAPGSQTKLADCPNSPKGSEVFFLDADDGTLKATGLRTDRSVVADLSFVDVNNDQVVDFGYAVDSGGGVYRVDLRTSTYSITKIAQTDVTSGRKFLNAPALLLSKVGDVPVVYLAIGSGDREHPLRSQYPFQTNVLNRFYVFKDLPTQPVGEGEAATLMLDDDEAIVDQNQPEVADQCYADAVTPGSDKRGWYINLDEHGSPGDSDGEQVITSAVIVGGRVFFSTNQPGRAAQQQELVCTNDLGIARGYSLDIITGEGAFPGGDGCADRSREFAGGGLPPPPVIAEVPVCDADGDNCRTENICIGCITTNGELTCGDGSPLEACPNQMGIRPVRRPLYWHTTSDAE
jgi:type IV pilus assembly protein PilY1